MVAIGSRNISKAQAFIDEMKLGSGVKAYGSYEEVSHELILDPELIYALKIKLGRHLNPSTRRSSTICVLIHPKIYGNHVQVLADPRVDAVYLPLPTAIHVPWVRKAAAQGKHILLEKPIALASAFSLPAHPPEVEKC